MADISQPSSSKGLAVPSQQDDEGIDLNNNDPNNNTDFQEEEVVESPEEDIQVKLLNEARTINSILSQYSVDEIYSYLEMNIDHPQRMQFVMDNFLARSGMEMNNTVTKDNKRPHVQSDVEEVPRKEMRMDNLSRSPSLNEFDDSVYVLSSDDEMDYQSDKVPTNSPAAGPPQSDHADFGCIGDMLLKNESLASNRDEGLDMSGENDGLNLEDISLRDNEPNVEHLNVLYEMFPTRDRDVLKARYISVLPIEGERTLDVLAAQLLDVDDTPILLNSFTNPTNTSTTPTTSQAGFAVKTRTIAKEGASRDDPQSESKTNFPKILNNITNTHHDEPIAGPSGLNPDLQEIPEAVYEDELDEGDSIVVEPEFQQQLSYLLAVLPNADPNFLEEKCREYKGNQAAMDNFVSIALETNEYPTLMDFNEREKQNLRIEEESRTLRKFAGRLTVPEFLEAIPDPEQYFKEKKAEPLDFEYTTRSICYLLSRFRNIAKNSITSMFRQHGNHLSNTVEGILKGHQSIVLLKKQRPIQQNNLQDCKHLHFLQEVMYLEKEAEIKEYKQHVEQRKRDEFEQAKLRGELLECGCCFDSECLITDMSTCPEGHLFCKECIRKFAENEIGDGKTKFKCLDGECNEEFTLSVLQQVLSSKVFSRLVQKKQVEEVTAANIEGLESCPFCDFGTIPVPGDRIFRCLNPDCMKDSCRECKEPSHIPLRCDEVEKDAEVKARKFLEDRMTEALVRECYKCKKKFVKIDGCNKMTCSCGAKMCYVCRQPIQGYDHFNNDPRDTSSKKCLLYVNNDELHVEAVKKEAEKALSELKEKDPEVTLKHDPTKFLPEPTKQQNGPLHLDQVFNHVNMAARQRPLVPAQQVFHAGRVLIHPGRHALIAQRERDRVQLLQTLQRLQRDQEILHQSLRIPNQVNHQQLHHIRHIEQQIARIQRRLQANNNGL